MSKMFQIYFDKIKKRISFEIGKNYYVGLPTKEIRDMLGFREEKIKVEKKSGDLVPRIEPVTLVLVHCNLVNNEYQRDSKLLYTFVPDKGFRELLSIEPSNFIFNEVYGSSFYNIDM